MPEIIRKRIDSLFERTAKKAQLEEAEYMERRRQRLGEDKVRNTKAFNLFKRLVEFKEETLRFMTDFDIPFDNHGSEQDVRNGKVKQTISGCFRSEKGAKWYARVNQYRQRNMSKMLSPLLLNERWQPQEMRVLR